MNSLFITEGTWVWNSVFLSVFYIKHLFFCLFLEQWTYLLLVLFTEGVWRYCRLFSEQQQYPADFEVWWCAVSLHICCVWHVHCSLYIWAMWPHSGMASFHTLMINAYHVVYTRYTCSKLTSFSMIRNLYHLLKYMLQLPWSFGTFLEVIK